MFLAIIESFLPWILFFIFMGKSAQHVNIAIIIAALASIICELRGLKQGFILSWGTLVFFSALFIAIILFHQAWLAKYVWISANTVLAIIAWLSLLLSKPFTLQYAKQQVASDKWQHPIFLRINYLLTLTWAGIFTIGVLLNILRFSLPSLNGWIYEVSSYVPSIFGIWFTTWFPRWYRDKL